MSVRLVKPSRRDREAELVVVRQHRDGGHVPLGVVRAGPAVRHGEHGGRVEYRHVDQARVHLVDHVGVVGAVEGEPAGAAVALHHDGHGPVRPVVAEHHLPGHVEEEHRPQVRRVHRGDRAERSPSFSSASGRRLALRPGGRSGPAAYGWCYRLLEIYRAPGGARRGYPRRRPNSARGRPRGRIGPVCPGQPAGVGQRAAEQVLDLGVGAAQLVAGPAGQRVVHRRDPAGAGSSCVRQPRPRRSLVERAGVDHRLGVRRRTAPPAGC